MCTKKCFYKREAEIAIRRNKKSSRQYRKESRYYYCEECNAWHLTSQDDREDIEPIKLKYKNKWKKLMIK